LSALAQLVSGSREWKTTISLTMATMSGEATTAAVAAA